MALTVKGLAAMEHKPWYLSRGVWGSIFAILGQVGPLNQWLTAHGYANVFDSANVDATIAAIGNVVSAVSTIVALYGRVKATGPVTLTAANADAANAK